MISVPTGQIVFFYIHMRDLLPL